MATNKDSGYDSFVFDPDAKKPDRLHATCLERHTVLNYLGRVTMTPTECSSPITTMWGLEFFLGWVAQQHAPV